MARKMVVTKIDPQEIPKMGRPIGEETAAVRALQPGEAIKFPCRWKHSYVCHGAGSFRASAKDSGFRIITRCKDKMVYVMRIDS
jgi:hypothetical protein